MSVDREKLARAVCAPWFHRFNLWGRCVRCGERLIGHDHGIAPEPGGEKGGL